MRIVIVWEQHSWGGVDSHLLRLLNDWEAFGDSVVILYNIGNAGFLRINDLFRDSKYITARSYRSLSYNQMMSDFRESRFGRIVKVCLYFLQPLLFFIDIFVKIFQLRSIGKFDVLIANNGSYPGAWGCLSSIIAAQYLRIKCRLLLVHHSSSRAQVFFSWFESIVDRQISRALSGVICVSHATKYDLISKREFDPEVVRFRVIHNFVVPQVKPHLPRVSDPQKPSISRLRQSTEDVVILIVGRIERYKGHEDILFALSRIDSEIRSSMQVAVIGSGDAAEVTRLRDLALRLNIEANLHFFGYIDGDISAVISEADILVSATQSFEGFGLTIVEAMSRGVPVIATSVAAVTEVISSESICVISPGDPGALAFALEDYIARRNFWLDRSKKAMHTILAKDDTMASEYRRVMLELSE